MTGMLALVEDDTYYFDAEAGDRVVRFIHKFIVHLTGPKKETPFILEPIQQQIVREIFGWKRRDTHKRRFRDVYWEGAVGCGKSPLLAAIGIYGLVADGETAAEVYSLASTFSQAGVVFAMAKAFIEKSPALSRILRVVDRAIRHRASGSVWKIVSGKGPGSGAKPSMILADEVHDWAGSEAYDALNDRKIKREQPLLIAATNSGKSQASFCWRLREKAVLALRGEGYPALYPIIWAADETDATDDPAAWRKANPLLGVTLKEEDVRAECVEKMRDESETSEFRRLKLSIWPKKGADRWLDLSIWDDCTANFSPAKLPKRSPLYVGLDLSESDDLSAAVFVWLTARKAYVSGHFWMPKVTAERYHARYGVDYLSWAKAGHISLVPTPTISSVVRKEIAARVVSLAGKSDLKAVCYDRYKADETIAALEAAGLTCVPIPQGYTLSPGCNELDRRLKERAIIIAPNPVMRWCAENTETKSDDRGNIWPVKPNAKDTYAGRRGLKIDSTAALVTAMVEARKHAFPNTKEWKGEICSLSQPRQPARA